MPTNTVTKTKKAKYFTPQSRLTKGQRKYCKCLMHVRAGGQQPYGICYNAVSRTAKRLRRKEPNQYKPGTINKANCTLSYQYEDFTLKEVQALAKERKIPITYIDKKTKKRKQYSQNKLVEFITKKEINKIRTAKKKVIKGGTLPSITPINNGLRLTDNNTVNDTFPNIISSNANLNTTTLSESKCLIQDKGKLLDITSKNYEDKWEIIIRAAQLSSIIYLSVTDIIEVINITSAEEYNTKKIEYQENFNDLYTSVSNKKQDSYKNYLSQNKSIINIKDKQSIFIYRSHNNHNTVVIYSDGNTLYIVFKGTSSKKNIMTDLKIFKTKTDYYNFHKGFYEYFNETKLFINTTLEYIHNHINKLESFDNIVFTGHSLGGAASGIAYLEMHKSLLDISPKLFGRNNIYNITFGCPSYIKYKGDVKNNVLNNFLSLYHKNNIFHFRNKCDIVTKLPCGFTVYGNKYDGLLDLLPKVPKKSLLKRLNMSKKKGQEKEKEKGVNCHSNYLGVKIGGYAFSTKHELNSFISKRKKHSYYITQYPINNSKSNDNGKLNDNGKSNDNSNSGYNTNNFNANNINKLSNYGEYLKKKININIFNTIPNFTFKKLYHIMYVK